MAAWNVNGLAGPDRVKAVQQWLKQTGKGVGILALQELKANEGASEFNLRRLIPNATCIVDYAQNDRGGAALLIHPRIQVEERGVKGTGNVAWARTTIAGRSTIFASIYGPHDGEGKIQLFQWLHQLTEGNRCFLLGDWSMVLDPRDSSGPSPLLKGSPLQAWSELEQAWALEDAFSRAWKREGPRYTRQVVRSNRLDQSRLGRIYISNNGACLKVKRLLHDSESAISDHIPVLLEVNFNGRTRRNKRRPETYLKLDVDSFRHADRRERVKTAWLRGWGMSPDPIIAWELAWGQTREVFREFRQEDRSWKSDLQKLQRNLAQVRVQLAEDPTLELSNHYNQMEKVVREKELLEASILRRRSRIQWIQEGEANSKYFFQCIRAKKDHGRLTALQEEDGSLIEDEEQIRVKVRAFYQNLYLQPEVTHGEREDREQVLQLVDRYASESENLTLSCTPNSKEVRETLDLMARGKAPGEDGVTIEVLKETWEWTETPCVTYIQAVWENVRMGKNNGTAIVKLLPKNQERLFLKNWRPICLLTLSYKLIGKILATRLKGVFPHLVDEDQSGFVEGRCIMDNVLNLKLCQDVTNATGEPSLFCRLDFEKAFDRVQHEFLWATLRQMKISHKFISMVQMLVGKGRAKVQVNGVMTETIELQRGVRQGCPISPMLFAASTQPLMKLLREAEKQGSLKGVNIPGGRPLLHKLFADDSGVCIAATEENFNTLRKIIERFERISGAKLNLSKSVILPMIIDRTTPWLLQTGCKILNTAEDTVYLGCKVGAEVEEVQHELDLTSRMGNRLAQWTNRFLTLPARILMIKHILRALPVYQLMGLGLSDKGFKRLEMQCRIFLWGEGQSGKAKTPLVGWNRITMRKEAGGLGLRSFKDVGDILKMKYVQRFLAGEKTEWASMFRYLVHKEMKGRAKGNEYRWWTAEEGLLLLHTIPTPKNSIARHFMKAWIRFRRFLVLDNTEWMLPGSLSLAQLHMLAKRYDPEGGFNGKTVLPLLKKLQFSAIMHLQDSRGGWANVKTALNRKGIQLTLQQQEDISVFQKMLQKIKTGVRSLQESTSWRWRGTTQVWKGWIKPTNFWSSLLSREEVTEDLTEKWAEGGSRLTWGERWKYIWSNNVSTRTKIWFWRTLKHGFFTGERAERMRVSTEPCKRCGQSTESTNHLFWSCTKVVPLWSTLKTLASTTCAKFSIWNNLLDTMDKALISNHAGNSLSHILATLFQQIWHDRNKEVFEQTRRRTPLIVALEQARQEAEGQLRRCRHPDKQKLAHQAIEELNELIKSSRRRTTHLSTGSTTREELETATTQTPRFSRAASLHITLTKFDDPHPGNTHKVGRGVGQT
ncbi:hypothetical protein R1sor_022343 [Riccia sorocarpa]|uniref:Reverse transcriptase domain-containing protein n=1 Tax=Riccia sorocarpa TaxID=122646 RepID=A0ABD3GMJ7_9MARC